MSLQEIVEAWGRTPDGWDGPALRRLGKDLLEMAERVEDHARWEETPMSVEELVRGTVFDMSDRVKGGGDE